MAGLSIGSYHQIEKVATLVSSQYLTVTNTKPGFQNTRIPLLAACFEPVDSFLIKIYQTRQQHGQSV
ncbi:hypothetical protein CLV58_109110 [Spirosoma oryzae]|uniref:Uncharacterized protein n=1 Tax=Spirosoma oryzae TaxID=1469603 RepID=A0A2T0SYE8_9BACT|nr:hypothetical protein CLV58_109110 [Spirosoma oryzae]